MSHWTDLPFLCIDTETTGVSPFDDRIVELGTALVTPDGTVTDSWTRIINPGVDIPAGAAEVHGITTERAQTEGAPPDEVLWLAAEAIAEHQATWGGQAGIVMFNARFDWPLLLIEAERHNVEIPATAAILDPYLIDRLLDRYRSGKRKLMLVAAHYGVELSEAEAHGALADCVAAGRIMHRIVASYPQLRTRSLASMWMRQVQGHEEDRLRFAAYMRDKVDPAFTSQPGWPLPVAREAAAS